MKFQELTKPPSKRPQNLLRKKSRPMTPNPLTNTTDFARTTTPSPRIGTSSPQTPDRPKTSHAISSFSPRSTVNANSRHSTYIAPTAPMTLETKTAPSTPERPKTSHSIRHRLSHRPTTSGGEEHVHKGHGHVRKWSSGLRSLFHKHG